MLKQINESEKMSEKLGKKYDYIYVLDNYPFVEYAKYIWSNNQSSVVKRTSKFHPSLKDDIDLLKKVGVRFKSTDDDDGDEIFGYYYSDNGINFEPLEYLEADRGHTKLYSLENGKYSLV